MSAPAATQVTVPDIGDFSDVPIIEVHVALGDVIAVDDPLLTLESDKATMDVPSSHAGLVTEVLVAVGDQVSQGTPVVVLDAGEGEPAEERRRAARPGAGGRGRRGHRAGAGHRAGRHHGAAAPPASSGGSRHRRRRTPAARRAERAQARPRVRRRPGEHPRDRARRAGSRSTTCWPSLGGPRPHRRSAAAPAAPSGGMGIPEVPAQDFSVFGPVETQPLSRITRISGPFLHRSWLNVPHVTHNDDADITETDRSARSSTPPRSPRATGSPCSRSS